MIASCAFDTASPSKHEASCGFERAGWLQRLTLKKLWRIECTLLSIHETSITSISNGTVTWPSNGPFGAVTARAGVCNGSLHPSRVVGEEAAPVAVAAGADAAPSCAERAAATVAASTVCMSFPGLLPKDAWRCTISDQARAPSEWSA